MHRQIVHEVSEGEILSDKSASSSTGSIQWSVDSAAASTDSVSAPMETPTPATSGVLKIAEVPLPDNRPHTISSAVYQHPVRPAIIPNTFELPTVTGAITSGPPGKVADVCRRPSLIASKDSRSTIPMAVATPTVPMTTRPVLGCDGTDVGSAVSHPFSDSSQHSSTESAMSQKRKNVSRLLLHLCVLCSICESLHYI